MELTEAEEKLLAGNPLEADARPLLHVLDRLLVRLLNPEMGKEAQVVWRLARALSGLVRTHER